MSNDTTRRAFSVSVVTNTAPNGKLCKVHRYDSSTESLRTDTHALLSRGTIESISFDSISAFVQHRAQLASSEALLFGQPCYPAATVLTQSALRGIPKPKRREERIIARDRAHISWSDRPSVVMLDLDRPEAFPDEVKDRLPKDPEGTRDFLLDCIPALRDVPMAWAPSSSSCIYRDAEELRGISGQRFYFVIDSGLAIPRFKEALRHALIERDLAWFQVSKSGSRLERYPFDLSVYQPERLDFAAGPECIPPLAWRPPDPIIWHDEGDYLHTENLPQISADEQAKAVYKLANLKQAVAEEAAASYEIWAQDTGRRIAARQGIHDLDLATSVARAAVEEDPRKHEGRRFHDPVEPDYRGDNRIAVFQLDGAGRASIYSHAHGGHRWRCSRRIITVRIGLIDETVDRIRAALEQDTCDLYRSGDAIVAIDEAEGRMKPLDHDALALRLHRRFDVVGLSQGGNWVPRNLPVRHLKALMSEASSLPIPRLSSVVRGPFARADGSIVDEPGYDPVGEVMYVSESETPPTVRREVDVEAATEALRDLMRPFSGFPFKSDLDRGVCLSAILTGAVRQSIEIAPGFMYTATMAGTGKTTLAQAVGLFQTGSPVPVSALPSEDDEIRKHLFASLRQGQTYLLLDNAERGSELASPVIANLITGPSFEGRVLGASVVESRPNRMTVAFTGNNIRMRGDLNRRILTVALDAKVERPWEREFDFNPIEFIRANWHHLRIAALEIIQAWRCAGAPEPTGSTGFPEWDTVVRGPICWLIDNVDIGVGFADPKDAMNLAYEDETESEELGALLRTWHELLGDREVLAREALVEAQAGEHVALGMASASPDDLEAAKKQEAFSDAFRLALRQAGGTNEATVLGRYLKAHEGVIVGGLRFESTGKSGGSRRWRVRRVGGEA